MVIHLHNVTTMYCNGNAKFEKLQVYENDSFIVSVKNTTKKVCENYGVDNYWPGMQNKAFKSFSWICVNGNSFDNVAVCTQDFSKTQMEKLFHFKSGKTFPF